MTTFELDDIQRKTETWLQGTRYAPRSIIPLSGGTVNFTFLVHLEEALQDGTDIVVVKHSEDFVRHTPSYKVSLARTDSSTGSIFQIRTPKCLHFDETAGMQIHEYLPHGVDLKTYLLARAAHQNSDQLEPQYFMLGQALGSWVRQFHDQASHYPELVEEVAKNKEAQQVQQLVTYQFAVDRVQDFPAILSDALPVLETVQKLAADELQTGSLQVIHGDLGPANILIPDSDIQEDSKIPVFVIDWETSQLGISNIDTGQMIADLYRLWLCKNIEAALWMLRGFCSGYGVVSEAHAFRTAIHAGVHLISRGTIDRQMGTMNELEGVARVGRDIVLNEHRKNRSWFEHGDLACLFDQIERAD
ncbi:kinase-like domain-containing protein [Cadophora sp. MPI-SDFR-AT-0126]|nr:kinase-like domain-containing protein [Leotiomycetes sp. MPI-SDFR-AT-0126]